MKYFYKLSNWCYRVINKSSLISATVILVLFMLFVLPHMAGRLEAVTGAGVSPDTSFYYSAGDLYNMAALYGEEGRAYYIYTRFTFDLVWPAVYLAFLVTATTFFYRFLPTGSRMRLVNLLPLGAAILDIMENSAVSLVMFRYPLPTPVAAHLAPVFTSLKWVMIILSFLSLAAGLILTVQQHFIKRK